MARGDSPCRSARSTPVVLERPQGGQIRAPGLKPACGLDNRRTSRPRSAPTRPRDDVVGQLSAGASRLRLRRARLLATDAWMKAGLFSSVCNRLGARAVTVTCRARSAGARRGVVTERTHECQPLRLPARWPSPRAKTPSMRSVLIAIAARRAGDRATTRRAGAGMAWRLVACAMSNGFRTVVR